MNCGSYDYKNKYIIYNSKPFLMSLLEKMLIFYIFIVPNVLWHEWIPYFIFISNKNCFEKNTPRARQWVCEKKANEQKQWIARKGTKCPFTNDVTHTSTHSNETNREKKCVPKKIRFVILILTCDYDYDDLMKIFEATKHLLLAVAWRSGWMYGLVSVIE